MQRPKWKQFLQAILAGGIVLALIVFLGIYGARGKLPLKQEPSGAIEPDAPDLSGNIGLEALSGEDLSRQFCVSCHVYTEPDLLPKSSWRFLLTYMGLRLGIDDDSYLGELSSQEELVLNTRRTLLADEGLIPETPAMPESAWRKLREFYEENAPLEPLPQAVKPAIQGSTAVFAPKPTRYDFRGAVTTMIRIDEKHQQVLIGDSLRQQLTLLDRNQEEVISYPTRNAFWVDAVITEAGVFLLSVGDIEGAFVQGRLGKIAYGRRNGDLYDTEGFVLKNLYRPSDMEVIDLNNDGILELAVCNFGDEGGNFSIYGWDNGIRGFNETPLLNLYTGTGPIKCAVHDFNADGLADIVLIVSDVKEHLSLFVNQGNGTFEEIVILETHPSWGYIGLELADLNQDGHMDILTGNGDNVDSDPYNTLKRFHGIRAYINDGAMNFTEEFFYPMNGCYQVKARDFDNDGDVDLVANAFYPDFNAEPRENFVYLEQTGPMQFTPWNVPATQTGRWMCLDAGDIDGDGDQDVVLGATYSPMGMADKHMDLFEQLQSSGPPILVLENQTVR